MIFYIISINNKSHNYNKLPFLKSDLLEILVDDVADDVEAFELLL